MAAAPQYDRPGLNNAKHVRSSRHEAVLEQLSRRCNGHRTLTCHQIVGLEEALIVKWGALANPCARRLHCATGITWPVRKLPMHRPWLYPTCAQPARTHLCLSNDYVGSANVIRKWLSHCTISMYGHAHAPHDDCVIRPRYGEWPSAFQEIGQICGARISIAALEE